MVYVHPRKDFCQESRILIKIQIDNSLELGWGLEDIILVTNFHYEYRGVRAFLIGDENYCDFYPMATKENVIIDLIKGGVLQSNTLYWFHDLDCYQCEVLTEEEINLGEHYLALSDYGRMVQWNTGSMFFTTKVLDIFEVLRAVEYAHKLPEEHALCLLTEDYSDAVVTKYLINNRHSFDLSRLPRLKEFNRIKRLNISYNFTFINVRSNYTQAVKPIRVIHFHPFGSWRRSGIPRLLDFYKGKNKINRVLMPQRLIQIFDRHGIV